jgi:hypothetical protein
MIGFDGIANADQPTTFFYKTAQVGRRSAPPRVLFLATATPACGAQKNPGR